MIKADLIKTVVTYQGKQELHITGEFSTGSTTKIHGPSGSGKTTFLKMIAGLITPDNGTITVSGISWFDKLAKINLPPQKRKVGFVFQDYALFPNMTVQQHLEYATDDKDWITRLLLLAKMETLSRHKPIHLSGGQQQRLAILRALAIKPQLLLMDEPFSGLDPDMKHQLIIELKTLFNQLGTTVLIVSHNPVELNNLTDNEFIVN